MVRSDTKQRLIDEALRLFAERGFRGTTVGDIEAAAGLTPRSGGLYQHFPSKQALLEAALDRHIRDVERIGDVIEFLPLADLRSELTLMGRWILKQLADERDLCRVLEKEGDQFPELVEMMRERISNAGYRQGVEYAARRLKLRQSERGDVDLEALVTVLCGSLVNYRRNEWTFGVPPLEVDEERFLTAWVEVCAAVVPDDPPA